MAAPPPALALVLALCPQVGTVDEESPVESPADEFRRIGLALTESDCPSVGTLLLRTLEGVLERDEVPAEMRPMARLDLGRALLDQGRVEEAIATLDDCLREARERGVKAQERRALRLLALAWLRRAEDLNCVESHAPECCILPLDDGGVHGSREPALRARELYTALLEDSPGNLGARWILNVLGVLLGDHPDGVPEEHRIALAAFGAPSGEPRFRDVAARAGVVTLDLAGGALAEDLDGDGWIDLLSSTSDPLGPLVYHRSKGDGTFEDRSESSRASEQLGGLNLIAGDYDNDGDPDPLVLRGGWMLDHGRVRNSLLRNDGGESFVDVTRAAGLAEPAYPTQTAVFADLDSDGWLDLYVGNEARLETEGQAPYPCQLFLNGGDGTFRDFAAEAGATNLRYTKGVAAGDYDDDGDLDLYLSNSGTNRLYRNDGKARFEDVAEAAGVQLPRTRTFATWFFDQDQDGRLDLWVGAYSASIGDLAAEALGLDQPFQAPSLFWNRGDGTFEDRAEALGLARPFLPMGANFCDHDGDGWLDVYLGTGDPLLQSLMPNVLLRNVEGRRFEDRTASSGLGHLQKGHGVAFADLDHDGDQDLFHQLGGFVPADRFQNALFENTGPVGRWLSLDLVGTRTNRDAIGARVRVVVRTADGERRTLHRAVGSVSSFGGSTLRQEIGLGDAAAVELLEVRWPRSAEPQVFEDVPLDAFLRVTEGSEELERLARKSFTFPDQR